MKKILIFPQNEDASDTQLIVVIEEDSKVILAL